MLLHSQYASPEILETSGLLGITCDLLSPRGVRKVLLEVIQQGYHKRTCEANPAGENSPFIFTVCIKSVPLYHFKLAYVVLHMAVDEFLETSKMEKWAV